MEQLANSTQEEETGGGELGEGLWSQGGGQAVVMGRDQGPGMGKVQREDKGKGKARKGKGKGVGGKGKGKGVER